MTFSLCTFAKNLKTSRILNMCIATSGSAKTWSNTVYSDLKWLSFFPHFASRKDWTFVQWCTAIIDEDHIFKKSVVRTCRSPLANVVSQWATTESQAIAGCHFECHVCNKMFMSKQKCALHQFKVHGIRSIERRYIVDDSCPICLVKFWSRTRVLNHLKYRSKICQENLLIRPPLISEEEASILDEAERAAIAARAKKGLKPAHAAKPCVQMFGPLVQVVSDPSTASGHHPLGRGRNYLVAQ